MDHFSEDPIPGNAKKFFWQKVKKHTENITFFAHLYTLITWTISFGLDKDLANLVKDLPKLASGQGIWAKPPLDKDLGQASS